MTKIFLGNYMESLMIAPCGMNCNICIGHMREKNTCNGCRSKEGYRSGGCTNCVIFNCEKLALTNSGFCYDCPTYPCYRMKQLDKRYSTRYGMSMFENLAFIKENGMEAFLKHEEERWACPECGAKLSVHRKKCLQCGAERNDLGRITNKD